MGKFVVTHRDHGDQVYFVDFGGRNKCCAVTTTFLEGAKVFEHEIVAQEVACELSSRKHYADNPWRVVEI